jgi:exopolyphosphatase/guanosine-5'-triphosphate,3'-diphosphate pyrophosphatase
VSRVAAIDCGTNSIRLLIADVDSTSHAAHELDRRMTIVRLGEGVDRTGRFADAALQRTFAACDEFAAVIARFDVERVRFVATSASRDVANRDAFVDGVHARLGVTPEVITGHTEAALSFAGATRGLAPQVRAAGPMLVLDIGGGSTEFVLGRQEPTAAISVDMGCVRLTERVLHGDPPTPTEIAEAVALIDGLIDVAAREVPLDEAATVIGLAGSVTTVAAVALGLPEYDRDAIHGAVISASDVHRVSSDLLRMPREDRARLGVMHPGRVDVIGGGALVLDRIVQRVGAASVLVSEHDILDGIAWSLAP